MRGSLLNLPNIGFGLALAVLVSIALFSYHVTQSVAEAAEDRRLALVRLDQLQELLATGIDIETGERGYVITGDKLFLEPFKSGIERLDPQLDRLRAALADHPRQQPALVALRKATTELVRQSRHVIALKTGKDDDSAQRAVASGDGKQIMDHIRQLVEVLRAEEHAQLQDGEQHYQARVRWSMFTIVAGSLFGFAAVGLATVAINRSLRDRTRLNADLRQALAEKTDVLEQLHAAGVELTRSNQELEEFAYVASHDLQEPLRKVSSFAQLLAVQYKGKIDADADEFIGYMVDGAQRMQTLIQNLLAYSRLGRKGRPFAPVDVNVVLNEALLNLQTAIEESGTIVTSALLPTVQADDIQMVQLLQNLIANAIKFHGAEKPLIHLQAEAVGPAWTFSVHDNGIGIDTQFAERIFVIFQRLHSRENYPGTGIGLAVCKKIVERHGGRIWMESQPGQGTTFFFTLTKSVEQGPMTP